MFDLVRRTPPLAATVHATSAGRTANTGAVSVAVVAWAMCGQHVRSDGRRQAADDDEQRSETAAIGQHLDLPPGAAPTDRSFGSSASSRGSSVALRPRLTTSVPFSGRYRLLVFGDKLCYGVTRTVRSVARAASLLLDTRPSALSWRSYSGLSSTSSPELCGSTPRAVPALARSYAVVSVSTTTLGPHASSIRP